MENINQFLNQFLYIAPDNENDIDPAHVKSIIQKNWNSEHGILVNFIKKGGSLRRMLVKLDEATLAPKSELSAGTISRRETNKANGNMVVTEFLPEMKGYQVRTIPLKNVQTIQAIG